jgi:hypothetical protein
LQPKVWNAIFLGFEFIGAKIGKGDLIAKEAQGYDYQGKGSSFTTKTIFKSQAGRKSQRKSRLYGQQAFVKLVKEYGLIKPYVTSGIRPVNAL